MEIVTIETPELGDRSYVVGESGSGGRAVVVDPQRDLDRVEAVLASEGWTCVLVVETHLHNDYVSGGLERSRRTGAEYAVHGGDEVSFQRRPVRDGDVLTVGALELRVVDTPGHTEHHVSYVIGGQPAAVFSGGSLLYGAVGRTDLVHPGRTEDLTHAQYHSARKLALLNDEDALYPTHGFGSMCSAGGSSGATESTIAEEKRVNVALTESDEERFVADLLAGLTAYPAYYVHMSGRNAAGPTAADLSLPAPVDPDEVAKRIAAGEWVVDLRDRTAYAAEHLAASLADLAGRTEVRGYPRRSFSDLAAEDDATVLDVRRDDEGAGGAIVGSTHVPLHSMFNRLDEVTTDRLWVHCASGFRASIAASLLDRAGRDVVFVDDEWEHAAEAGLRIV